MRLRNKKTGKVYTLSDNLFIEYTQGGRIELRAIIPGGNMSYYYDSLAELNEEWEDYKPSEPLIKDEKIRKAVRAWAEANEITNIYCYQYIRTCEFDCENLDLDCCASMSFIGGGIIDKRHDNSSYTIDELCGEEEE